jgi:hypothetical protein
MADGREYSTAAKEGRAHNLFINDPFAGSKAIRVLAAGDLEHTIENIFLDLSYRDDQNAYTQEASIALNAATPFFDWVIPVIDESLGKVTYSGNLLLTGGTVRPIVETLAQSSTIVVPKAPQEIMEVQVITDLIDFSSVKLVRFSLDYEDIDNFASLHKDLVFSKANVQSSTLKIPIYDRAKKTYHWQASFFLTNNTRKSIQPTDATDSVVILEVPA